MLVKFNKMPTKPIKKPAVCKLKQKQQRFADGNVILFTDFFFDLTEQIFLI